MGTLAKEHVGMNRTGIQMSPIDAAAMQDYDPALLDIVPDGDETDLARIRAEYIAQADAFGSVPLPGTLTGAVSMGIDALKGESPQILLDKLAERLAFERGGTRLYDALIQKATVLLDDNLSMTLDDLARIREDEARHYLLVKSAIESIGGDPTAMTPSADLVGVESMGLVQVLSDPRTNLTQSLHAILTAELTDNTGWETLIALADLHDKADMVEDFTQALNQEREHLSLVQTWYEESMGLSYGDVEIEIDEQQAPGAGTSSLS